MAFDEDPAIVAVNPVVSYPTRAGMGRTIPAAGNPDIALTVPAVIPVDPHEAPFRRTAALFGDDGRGANANHNLRK
jgi:hypothetical protein